MRGCRGSLSCFIPAGRTNKLLRILRHSPLRRSLSCKRLEETDEMLWIFKAETLADHCDGQRLVVLQLSGNFLL